jgi:hypothetical protein
MEEIARTVGPIALIASIASVVAGAIIYLLSTQVAQNRETLRKLRVALERDPTPSQLGEAMKIWPESAKFTAALQKTEMVRLAHNDETKLAQKNEMMKGMSRSVFFLAAFAGAIFVASIFLGRPATPEPAPAPTDGSAPTSAISRPLV